MDIYDTAGEQIAKAFNDRAHILEMIKLELENNILTIQIRAQQAFALSGFMRGINEQWITPCKTNYCNMDGTGQYWTDRIDNVRMIDIEPL